MLNLNWEKIHSIILSVTCHGLRNFPLLIHIPLYPFVNFWNPMSYYFLSLSFDPAHPTPPLHDTPHPTPPLHDPPHPTPPHLTPSWPTHPTLPHPTPDMTHPTPPHPTPSWTTHPTLPHPTLSWPTHPTPPTPPLVHFWAQRSLFSWAASLCLPSVDKYVGNPGKLKLIWASQFFQLLAQMGEWGSILSVYTASYHMVSSKIKQCVSHLYLPYTICTMSFYCSHHVVLLILQKIALSCLDYWCLYRHQCDLPERAFWKKKSCWSNMPQKDLTS